ncbi:pyrroloquinoline quinone biosynthesis protein PqqE [Paracoccus sp. MC1862]|uniref:pyrroloquinoline quinone biosynthesis protein PqqE n=1 Tax=Paracoccus sp. MC1862 TaxID=2760307 RepID=UPI0016023F64|nr:pyrroloquinoline quinone biosynthesis protein PqqE [Paracoccus sp. MC1862]MBB1498060.1 pyrroloquinoline quinone biosynthesis protein PqqE [Paracoccus sp. MC1862]QQO43500.1 pyrroloquinoline quinone biosynthesis protein PqqE [Paracoccus sp. MC1862]
MTVVHPTPVPVRQVRPRPDPPLAMLAELTHRCPLSCPYCSNPLELTARERELTTEQWAGVFRQAADMGVLQLHISGGEPASRPDLVQIVAAAREAGLYTNLITSGIGLTGRRLDELDAAGLDHVQLSVQGVNAGIADTVGGYKGGFDRKMMVAAEIARIGFPLTINAVMHRHNLGDLPQTIALAHDLGARRIEIACVQFQGWALKNRSALQPTREQVDEAKRVVAQARVDYAGRLAIDFVPPDYFADFPKACMNGWGSTGLNVTPEGKVLPCHAAEIILGLTFQNVLTTPLAEIWNDGPAFNAFRGTDWMPDLCQTCERRDIDFGGCRCQAMAIAGDARATDPVCRRSPHRAALDALIEAETSAPAPAFEYRRMPR